MKGCDRDLGMGRSITRRDLLSGMGIALSGSLLLPWANAKELTLPKTCYPPALTGLRGNHPGSFEVAHAHPRGRPLADMDGIVTALLDRKEARVRLRLESTAVNVAHRGNPSSATEVEVTYVKQARRGSRG